MTYNKSKYKKFEKTNSCGNTLDVLNFYIDCDVIMSTLKKQTNNHNDIKIFVK